MFPLLLKVKSENNTIVSENKHKMIKINYRTLLLWYHPYFRYTMDSSNKDILFDWNPVRELVARATWATLYYLFSCDNLYSSLLIHICLTYFMPFSEDIIINLEFLSVTCLLSVTNNFSSWLFIYIYNPISREKLFLAYSRLHRNITVELKIIKD